MAKAKTVDAWLADQAPEVAAVMQRLREIILAADPGLGEHIKWNGPSFTFEGDDRITSGLHRGQTAQIVFHRGVKARDASAFRFDDPSGLMTFAAPDRAFIRLADLDAVQRHEAELTTLVQRWLVAAR
jgi:hypothetical protein